jgi:hypothetical protein
MSLITPAPGSVRNGLPGFRPYVYRGTGTDELTPELDVPGRRVHWDEFGNGWAACGRPPLNGHVPDVSVNREYVTCRSCKQRIGSTA